MKLLYLLIPLQFILHQAVCQEKPNIIFLFADDQRADTISAHGNPHIKTPNLDKLSKEGMSFRNNFCAGSLTGAVCVTSRAMLMTGKHWLNMREVKERWHEKDLLPSYLEKNAGYESYIVGKWHNRLENLQASFRHGKSIVMGGSANHDDFHVQDYKNGELLTKRKAKAFSSTEFANSAIEFIQQADQSSPFFLYVSFLAPHDPRNPPEKYREMYYNNRPPLPNNFMSAHTFDHKKTKSAGRDESLAPWPRTKEVISDQLCEYYGLITQLDEQVGRILTALEKSPHAKNTIVVYTADHGLAMGSHGLLGKQNLYEQSMKCPLIIKGPNIPAGKSNFSYTYIHDLYSTLCTSAGIKAPKTIDSLDLTPLIKGSSEKVRDTLFIPFQDNRSISDGQFKLHIYPKINHRMFFNIEDDPDEMKDLIHDERYQQKVRTLEKSLADWRNRLNDSTPLVSENPSPKIIDHTKLERKLNKLQPDWIVEKYFKGISRPE